MRASRSDTPKVLAVDPWRPYLAEGHLERGITPKQRKVASMTKQSIRLLLADVDGTLVTQEKVLTQRAIDAVRTPVPWASCSP